jgi:adenosylcobinamide-GDP ribazoletransferase
VTPYLNEARFMLGTLTRLPVLPPVGLGRNLAGRALALTPVVGAGVGLASGIPLMVLGADTLSRLLAGTLTLALAAWFTGGLHWDGLADLADGLGSRSDPVRALEIMRSPEVGPMGTMTMGLTASVQIIALASVPSESALAAWVAICAAARLAITAGCSRLVRPAAAEGLGALVIGTVGRMRLLQAVLLYLVIAVLLGSLWATSIWTLILASGVALTVGLGLAWTCARRLGGSNGDVLGATCEIAAAACALWIAKG